MNSMLVRRVTLLAFSATFALAATAAPQRVEATREE